MYRYAIPAHPMLTLCHPMLTPCHSRSPHACTLYRLWWTKNEFVGGRLGRLTLPDLSNCRRCASRGAPSCAPQRSTGLQPAPHSSASIPDSQSTRTDPTSRRLTGFAVCRRWRWPGLLQRPCGVAYPVDRIFGTSVSGSKDRGTCWSARCAEVTGGSTSLSQCAVCRGDRRLYVPVPVRGVQE